MPVQQLGLEAVGVSPQGRDEVQDLPQRVGVGVGHVVLQASVSSLVVRTEVEGLEAGAGLLLDAVVLVRRR